MPSYHIPVWKRAPFVPFLFPFMIGIVAGWYFFIPIFQPFVAVGIFVMVSGFFLALLRILDTKLRRYAGVGVWCELFLFGAFLSCWHNDSLRPDFAGRFLTDSSFVRVQLKSELTEKKNSWKADAKVLMVMDREATHAARGNVILYFQKTDKMPDIGYGDILMVAARMNPIKNSRNPGSFDYQRYCRTKNIGYSAYLRTSQWRLIERDAGSALHVFFANARMRGVNILKKYMGSMREEGVAEALLLGYRNDLDPDLVQAYAGVGVVHLISISGLHVGLIYLVLLWILKILPRGSKFFKGLIIGICLWSFALLSGAEPATLRATVMITFLLAGKFFFNRDTDGFNVLAASAFVLLCLNPYLLFDVGFQLSYLAVAGIFIFQKPISRLFWFKNKLANYCWQMTSVSLSAEALTFPVALFYFHQFPALFLLSNLILIPVATLVLYGEILILAFSFIPAMAKVFGFIVTKLLVFIDGSVLWANSFSFVRWEYFNLTLPKLLLVYVFIILISVWLFQKSRKAFIAAISVLMVFVFLIVIKQWNVSRQEKFIVYQATGHTAFEQVTGRYSRYYCEDSIGQDSGFIKYTLNPSAGSLNIRKRDMPGLSESFFALHDKKFAVIEQSFFPDSLQGILPVDYVIVSKYNHLTMKEISEHFSPNSVILDASVHSWQRKKWKTACKQLNLHCFSVPDEGAWILSLK